MSDFFAANPFAATLEEIIRSNLWMYDMDRTTLKIVTSKVSQFYFQGRSLDDSSDVFLELVDVTQLDISLNSYIPISIPS